MIHLSRPSLWLPDDRLDNEEVLDRVRARYRGAPAEWPRIEEGIRLIFAASGSAWRHHVEDDAARIGTTAARVGRACLEANGVTADAIDMVIYGGICKEYLEPATATEVAAKLGAQQTRAMDVSSACAGQVLGIVTAWHWMRSDLSVANALVTTAELGREAATWDIQSYDELPIVGAGVTVGHAASAWLLSRAPHPTGGLAIVAAEVLSRPRHWQLSQTPLVGRFTSQSSEFVRIGGEFGRAFVDCLGRVGWSMDSVRQFFLHQPGRALHQRILAACGIPPERAVDVHDRYGNTATASVSTAAWTWLAENPPSPGDRFVLLAAGAGLSGAVLLGEWR